MKSIAKILLGLLFLVAFVSCNRDIMKEEVIKEMFSELDKQSFFINDHGIMEFKTGDDLSNVLDIISDYANRFDDKKNKYPDDPVYYAFEQKYKFKSLRQVIEDKETELEKKDALTEDNDPDNDYISPTCIRSIMTPQREIVVDGIICVYFDSFTIGINNYNYDLLGIIHDVYGKEGIEGVVNSFHNNADVLLLSDYSGDKGDRSFSVQIQCENIDGESLKYRFTPIINGVGQNPNAFTYSWNFGDGGTSTDKIADHTYYLPGEYEVFLTVLNMGIPGVARKTINAGSCIANFNATNMGEGKYNFSSTSSTSGFEQISYSWNFGDDTSHTTTENPIHQYQADGTYDVTLKITTSSGCVDTYSESLIVSGTPNGRCKKIGHDRERNILYADGTRKVKVVISLTNLWPYVHKLNSKVVNYKVKANGSCSKEKADLIETVPLGLAYLSSDCTTPIQLPPLIQKSNEKKVESGYNYGVSICVRKKSLGTYYYVRDNGATSSGTPVKIYD